MPTFYEILGCDRSASYEELKRRYHELVKKCHPDKWKERSKERSKEGSKEVEFEALDAAWKTLRDSERRREYDLRIGKADLDEMPLYCEVELSEMSREPETGVCSYVCRCGGVYSLTENDLKGSEKLKVPCDECTFHIVVLSNK